MDFDSPHDAVPTKKKPGDVMLSRRSLLTILGVGLASSALPLASIAGRYRNVSGLKPGRFVWNPAVGSEGPVAIVTSLGERIAHVYRGDAELAISTVTLAETTTAGSAGLYSVSAVGPEAGGGNRGAIVWRGTDLSRRGSAPGLVRLPNDMAALLQDATTNGTLVVMAPVRSVAQVVEVAGPFALEIETGTIGEPSVERFATPELSRLAAPVQAASAGRVTSVLISRADVSAYVLEDGRVAAKLPVAIEEPSRPFGLHAAMLLAGDRGAGTARWLAFGIDDDAGAAHVEGDLAAAAMRRVRFLDRARTAALADAMRPGAAMILIDGPGPAADVLPQTHIALLSSESAPTPTGAMTQDAPAPMPGAVARDAAGRRGSPSRKRAAKLAGSQPRRRGIGSPLDHREPWPYSMFWPY